MRRDSMFRDRIEAGDVLAKALARYRGRETLVLGIPRGGVVVAAEIARQLEAELDVVVARKLGAPGQPELAIGAVTAEGGRVLNEEMISALHVADSYLEAVTRVQMAEARPPPDVAAEPEAGRGDRRPHGHRRGRWPCNRGDHTGRCPRRWSACADTSHRRGACRDARRLRGARQRGGRGGVPPATRAVRGRGAPLRALRTSRG